MMIFARYITEDGSVYYGEGLDVNMAYEDLDTSVHIADPTEVTFWESQKMNTRVEVSVNVKVL